MSVMNNFGLIALRIPKECPQIFRKNLSQEYYLFDNRYEINEKYQMPRFKKVVDTTLLYGDYIHIGAIVGKNGSGKSSIIDMIYRIMNNVSAVLETQINVNQLIFIDNLYGELFYSVGKKMYRVSCLNHKVSLSQISGTLIMDLFRCNITGIGMDIEYGTIYDAKMCLTKLFYSIGTNYSVQSYLPSSYIEEIGHRIKNSFQYLKSGKDIWIKDVFNKNDGYVSPIVLNPYRGVDGTIDMENELELTADRLLSILYYYEKKGAQFLIDYSIPKIEFKYDNRALDRKFKRDGILTFNIKSFKKDISLAKSFARVIIDQYDIEQGGGQTYPYGYYMALAYLVYKTLNIASKYQNYSKYSRLATKNYYQEADKEEVKLIEGLVQQICADSSHITNKIKQTLQYLKIKDCKFQDSVCIEDYYKTLYSSLNDKKEAKELKKIIDGESKNINVITRNLPPPIFKPIITFVKTANKAETTLNKMSSGERQMICTMSTIIYHILNLQSVEGDKDRINYKNINIIFDEIEICFHPEYQREFVEGLINALKFLNNGIGRVKYNFNVLIATHSPFILSDIPSLFTLYLDNGEAADEKNTIGNPFGANVNDILRHSFFLDKGFGGEYSKKVITEVINILDKETLYEEGDDVNIIERTKQIKDFIDNIMGEGIIKECLRRMYSNAIDQR